MSSAQISGTCDSRQSRRFESALVISVFLSLAYFYNGAAWNHNSRLNTIFAFVEPGTTDYLSFSIDRFITDPANGVNTGDWAWYDGHFYSNKAPGIALVGIPFYAVIFHLERMMRINPGDETVALVNAYLIHLWTTVMPVAVASLCFFRLLLRFVARYHALCLTAGLVWGTLLFPFSTQIWGHATAAAFIMIALYVIAEDKKHAYPVAGFFAGAAVLTEYSCAITAVTLAAAAALRKDGRRMGGFIAGITPSFLAFCLYHKICFGRAITVANAYNNPYFLSHQDHVAGLFALPELEALWGLTFSPYRGLFAYMPVLLLVLPACTHVFRRRSEWLLRLAVVNIIAFLAMNTAFNGWHGGACTGPRYQIPVLPFYILLLTVLAKQRLWRVMFALLLIPSCLNMLLCSAISPVVPSTVQNPLLSYYRGVGLTLQHPADILQPWSFPIRDQSVITPAIDTYSAFNLGSLAGLGGVWSLLPWITAMAAAAAVGTFALTRIRDDNTG